MAINNRTALRLEVQKKIIKDIEVHRKGKEFAEDVRDYARRRALTDMRSGYATGKFIESITVERTRSRLGQFTGGPQGLPAWKVISRDPKAHLLEYGTGIDKEGVGSWQDLDGKWHKSPFTPTPEFATFAKTAFRFGGTPDGAL
jgi:hypothetical protein